MKIGQRSVECFAFRTSSSSLCRWGWSLTIYRRIAEDDYLTDGGKILWSGYKQGQSVSALLEASSWKTRNFGLRTTGQDRMICSCWWTGFHRWEGRSCCSNWGSFGLLFTKALDEKLSRPCLPAFKHVVLRQGAQSYVASLRGILHFSRSASFSKLVETFTGPLTVSSKPNDRVPLLG